MDSQVEEIKEKLPINEVVGQYVQLRRAGRNYTARCPFHKERTPSFHVSPERNSYMCFGCGEKGDIFSFIQKIEGVDFRTALKQLAEKAGVELKQKQFVDPKIKAEAKNQEERLKEVCESATSFFESVLRQRKDIQEYIHARGVKSETIVTWRIGYAPAEWNQLTDYLHSKGFSKDEIKNAGLGINSERNNEIYDRFRGRVMFPLFDVTGKTIAFSGRFFEKVHGSKEDAEPAKYVNSPETILFKKSKFLYGFHKAKEHIRESDCVMLVEGQFDVIMSHQSGYPIAVAISGTALTSDHLTNLGRFSKNLILALDADSAGIKAGLRSTFLASQMGFQVKVPVFPEGKDPADVAKENPELLKASIRTSKPVIEFFFNALKNQARDSAAHKLLAERQLLPLIKVMKTASEQAGSIRFLSENLGVQEAIMREKLRQTPESIAEDEEHEKLASATVIEPSDRMAGMILFSFPENSPEFTKVVQIVGKEKTSQVFEVLSHEAERLRFELDSLGEDRSKAVSSVLGSLERSGISQQITDIRKKIAGGAEYDIELLKRLEELKHKEQELRT